MNEDNIIFALVYVDDIVIIGNNGQQLQMFIDKLDACFALKYMGNLNQFLGIEVYRDVTGLYLTETKYMVDLLKKFDYENLKPVPTPLAVGKLISKDEGLYRSAVGGLQ
ncbi:uncharacterized protein LOC111383674 [Olea europaea var. sylvestris]|uniref:uncharacterized protein LOC111383674 n=1 Tax=Olea europaea var. sylvestris TaxID=158386 RepID=UPI000C1D3FB3|nr:uncharacterized protein LOC111383674 [Olea europaea var. sylvestris]